MKNSFIFFSIFIFGFNFAQYVGVNTTTPKSTMDVTGLPTDATKADGIIAPRITLAELNAKTSYGADQTGALLYVTNVSGGSTVPATVQITSIGYYYFNGTSWQSWASKTGVALFIASLGSGAGGQINATIASNGFRTIPLPSVTKNVGGGVWDATNYTYSVPTTGTYLIKSSVRLTDGSAARNVFQAVGTSNADIPDGIWQTNSGSRWTMLYTRIAYFTKNDLLRLYIYSDGANANISDASLNIVLLSEN